MAMPRRISAEEWARIKLDAANAKNIEESNRAAREATELFNPPVIEKGTPHYPVYRGGVEPVVAPLRRAPAPLSPAEQEALDDQLDYQDDWMATDEMGRKHLMQRPLSEMGIHAIPRNLQRQMDALATAEDERVRKAAEAKQKPKKPAAQRI